MQSSTNIDECLIAADTTCIRYGAWFFCLHFGQTASRFKVVFKMIASCQFRLTVSVMDLTAASSVITSVALFVAFLTLLFTSSLAVVAVISLFSVPEAVLKANDIRRSSWVWKSLLIPLVGAHFVFIIRPGSTGKPTPWVLTAVAEFLTGLWLLLLVPLILAGLAGPALLSAIPLSMLIFWVLSATPASPRVV